MTTLLANAHVVTMDDAGAEHERGWVLLADGLVSEVGAGPRPVADEAVEQRRERGDRNANDDALGLRPGEHGLLQQNSFRLPSRGN